jgi:hypothetical protein
MVLPQEGNKKSRATFHGYPATRSKLVARLFLSRNPWLSAPASRQVWPFQLYFQIVIIWVKLPKSIKIIIRIIKKRGFKFEVQL